MLDFALCTAETFLPTPQAIHGFIVSRPMGCLLHHRLDMSNVTV